MIDARRFRNALTIVYKLVPLLAGICFILVGYQISDRAGNETLIRDVRLVEIRSAICSATGMICICISCVCELLHRLIQVVETKNGNDIKDADQGT